VPHNALVMWSARMSCPPGGLGETASHCKRETRENAALQADEAEAQRCTEGRATNALAAKPNDAVASAQSALAAVSPLLVPTLPNLQAVTGQPSKEAGREGICSKRLG
jgi:hypothetical protein